MTRQVESVALGTGQGSAANVSQLRYSLALAIPQTLSRTVTASTVMRFRRCGRSKARKECWPQDGRLRDHGDPRRCDGGAPCR